jgi:putative ABC transport system permease protein
MHPGLKYLIGHYKPLRGSAAFWVYAALGLGIAAMVLLFRFSTRVETTITKDARKYLAADFQIQSRKKPTDQLLKTAKLISGDASGIALQTDLITSAVLPDGEVLSVSLRAIENSLYPFYGTFRVTPALNVDELRSGGTSSSGFGVFVDASMRERGLNLGDEVMLGSIKAKVLAYIEEEPQSAATAFSVGPRFMIHQEALLASQLTAYGSYAFYSLLIKSSLNYLEVQGVMKEHSPESSWRIVSPERANRQTERIVSRLESFLLLIAFAAFVLGGVGLFAIARFQILRNLSDWILFKALGLTKSDLLKFSVFWIALVSVVSLVIGFSLGAVLETGLTNLAVTQLKIELGDIAWFTALPHAMLLAFGASIFALGLPLLEVADVSPNQAWSATKSKSMDASGKKEMWIYISAAVLVAALAAFKVIAQSWLVAIFWGLATWAGAVALRRSSKVFSSLKVTVLKKYPFLWVSRSWSELKVLNYSISAAIFLMVLVAVIATTLRGQLQIGRSDSAPQAVALGLVDNQKEEVKLPEGITAKWIGTLQLRITHVKGEPVKMAEYDEEGERIEEDGGRSTFSPTREYVTNVRAELEENERILKSVAGSGELFSPTKSPDGELRMSIEQEFADRIEVTVGDTLGVNIAGVDLVGRVDSIRSVQWFRFQPSFFILIHPDDLSGAPLSYVGLMGNVTDIRALQRSIQSQFSNVAVIDSKSVAERLIVLIDRVILAISALGVFVFVAACWVFSAVLVSRRPAFRQDMYLLRLMGASAGSLRSLAFKHFLFLTVGTGVISAALAVVSAWFLAAFALDVSLEWIWVGYSLIGAMVVSVAFAIVGYVISGPYDDWRSEAGGSSWQPG